MISIEAKKRDPKLNLDILRKEGFVPAVFYGPKEASTSVTISAKELDKAWKEAGESSVITLTGEFGNHDALIHDINVDALTGKILHADFYIIEKGKKINVHVPVEFEGVSPAVKELGGILVKVLHEVEIEAMPKDLPHNLIVDISLIKDFDTHVTAGQIKLPSGVTLLTEADEIVAMASQPKEEVESAPIDLSAIEVEKKGKKEEESAE
jgi:large subunit ribosomal protein L25